MKLYPFLSSRIIQIIGGIVIVFYFYTHHSYSLNFPYYDEYRTICKVILDYINAPDWYSKLKVLLVNENESLQLLLKVCNIGFFKIFGEIRYDLLALIGRLALFSFPIVFWLAYKDNKDSRTYAIGIVILVVFCLQFYVLSFRHDTSFYYHLGLAGVLFSTFFWLRKNYLLASLFFVFGIFNNAASILIIPTIFIKLIIDRKNLTIKFVLLLSLILGIVLSLFYYINPNIFLLSRPLLTILKSNLILNGNYIEVFGFPSHGILYVAGIVHLMFFLITQLSLRKVKTNFTLDFLQYFSLFLFLSISAISLKRSDLFDHSYLLLDPRYKFFSFLSIMTLILIWAEISRFKKVIAYLSISIFLLINIYFAFQMQDYLRFLEQGAKVNSIAVDMGYDTMGQTHINYATKIYSDLKKKGIEPYKDKELSEIYLFLKNFSLSDSTTIPIDFDIETTRKEELGRFHTVKRIIGKSESKNSYIFLKSNNNTYLFPINFYLRNSKAGFIKTLSYTGNYFYMFLYLSVLEQGTYNLGLVEKPTDSDFKVKVYREPIVIDSKTVDFYKL